MDCLKYTANLFLPVAVHFGWDLPRIFLHRFLYNYWSYWTNAWEYVTSCSISIQMNKLIIWLKTTPSTAVSHLFSVCYHPGKLHCDRLCYFSKQGNTPINVNYCALNVAGIKFCLYAPQGLEIKGQGQIMTKYWEKCTFGSGCPSVCMFQSKILPRAMCNISEN